MRHSSQPFAAPFLCGHIAVLAASSALSPIIPFYLQQSLAELWRAGSNLTCSLLPPSSCSPSALHRVYSTNRLLLPKQKQRRWATQHNAGCVYQLKNEAISACMYKDLFFFFSDKFSLSLAVVLLLLQLRLLSNTYQTTL